MSLVDEALDIAICSEEFVVFLIETMPNIDV